MKTEIRRATLNDAVAFVDVNLVVASGPELTQWLAEFADDPDFQGFIDGILGIVR